MTGVSNTYSWVSGVTAPPVALETLLQMYVSVEVVSSGCSTKNAGTYPNDTTTIRFSLTVQFPYRGELHFCFFVDLKDMSTSISTSSKTNSDSLNQNGQKDLVKQLTFARLPECICFHIQRTAFEKGIPRKRNDPVLFPDKAKDKLLMKMPPTVVISGEFDIFLTETTRLANRLRSAGRLLEFIVFPGAKHSSNWYPKNEKSFALRQNTLQTIFNEYL